MVLGGLKLTEITGKRVNGARQPCVSHDARE